MERGQCRTVAPGHMDAARVVYMDDLAGHAYGHLAVWIAHALQYDRAAFRVSYRILR